MWSVRANHAEHITFEDSTQMDLGTHVKEEAGRHLEKTAQETLPSGVRVAGVLKTLANRHDESDAQ